MAVETRRQTNLIRIFNRAARDSQRGDNDGDSDGTDFLAWQQQLGSSTPATPAADAALEPGAAVLLIFAAGSIVRIGKNSWRRPSARTLR